LAPSGGGLRTNEGTPANFYDCWPVALIDDLVEEGLGNAVILAELGDGANWLCHSFLATVVNYSGLLFIREELYARFLKTSVSDSWRRAL
jgi:hypothetical protein